MNRVIVVWLFTALYCILSTCALAIDSKMVITCEQNIMDKWYKTLSEEAPEFTSVNQVVRQQYFTILVFFENYQLNDQALANITYDIKIENPQKGIYHQQKRIHAIHEKIEHPGDVLLSKTNLKVCFEPKDLFGTYVVTLMVTDENSKKTSKNSSSITLAPFDDTVYFKDDDSFLTWSAHYFSNPAPNKAVDAYIYYSKSELSETEDGFIPMFSFFLEVFGANPYLVPHLIERYAGQDERTRILIIYLLRYLSYDAGDFLNSLEGKDKEVYQKILLEKFPRSQDVISSPTHLDIQWAAFLATGSIDPIRNLIGVFEFAKYRNAVDDYESSPKTQLDKQSALKGAMFQAACLFLETNGKRHPLVAHYCRYLFKKGSLTRSERLWTGVVLSKIYPDKYKMKKEESGFWAVEEVE